MTIERLVMKGPIRSRSFVLALVLALSVGHATALPACLSAEVAAASSGAHSASTPEPECGQTWTSIKPAEAKVPIENPHRLGWREWAALAAGVGLLGLIAAGFVSLLRRQPRNF